MGKIDVDYPSTWQPQSESSELISVDPNTPEWYEVGNMFQSTLSSSHNDVSISNIQRVQNKWLWKKYFLQKKLMAEKNGILFAVSKSVISHVCRQLVYSWLINLIIFFPFNPPLFTCISQVTIFKSVFQSP